MSKEVQNKKGRRSNHPHPREGRRARKDRARKGGGATTALQDRHETRKEKEAQGEFLAPVWLHECHWHSTSPPLCSFPLISRVLPKSPPCPKDLTYPDGGFVRTTYTANTRRADALRSGVAS
jgi:hypothetical protein